MHTFRWRPFHIGRYLLGNNGRFLQFSLILKCYIEWSENGLYFTNICIFVFINQYPGSHLQKKFFVYMFIMLLRLKTGIPTPYLQRVTSMDLFIQGHINHCNVEWMLIHHSMPDGTNSFWPLYRQYHINESLESTIFTTIILYTE